MGIYHSGTTVLSNLVGGDGYFAVGELQLAELTRDHTGAAAAGCSSSARSGAGSSSHLREGRTGSWRATCGGASARHCTSTTPGSGSAACSAAGEGAAGRPADPSRRAGRLYRASPRDRRQVIVDSSRSRLRGGAAAGPKPGADRPGSAGMVYSILRVRPVASVDRPMAAERYAASGGGQPGRAAVRRAAGPALGCAVWGVRSRDSVATLADMVSAARGSPPGWFRAGPHGDHEHRTPSAATTTGSAPDRSSARTRMAVTAAPPRPGSRDHGVFP
jgi:hypothetical protein